MFCDRLVCGVNEETIQRCLLAESGLTLKKAVGIAQGLEAAARNVREIQTKPGELTNAAGHFQTEKVHESEPTEKLEPSSKVPLEWCRREARTLVSASMNSCTKLARNRPVSRCRWKWS